MQRLTIVVGLGIVAGIAALFGNSYLSTLGLAPLAFFVAAFAAGRSARGVVADIARAMGIGLVGLTTASAFVGVVLLLGQGIPALAVLPISLRTINMIWVGGGFLLGLWLLLGIVIRVLR